MNGAASGTRTRIEQLGRLTPNLSAIAALLIIAGCASQQTAVPVRVQVSVPCLTQDQLPAKPQISADADLLKLSDGDLVLTIAGERIALRSYAGELEAVMSACLKP